MYKGGRRISRVTKTERGREKEERKEKRKEARREVVRMGRWEGGWWTCNHRGVIRACKLTPTHASIRAVIGVS